MRISDLEFRRVLFRSGWFGLRVESCVTLTIMGISPAVVITSKLIKGIPRIQGTIPITLAMTLILMPSGLVRLTRAAMVPIRVEMTTAIQISLTPQLTLMKCAMDSIRRSEEHTYELKSQ